MALFNRYPAGMGAMPRRSGLRTLLMVLGIAFGLYFLNMAFLWIKIPVMSVSVLKIFNIVTGALLVLLGVMTVVRPRY